MKNRKDLVSMFEGMVDEKSTISKSRREEIDKIESTLVLGHSQFNEILLVLGFDRVYSGFFQFLVDGNTDYQEGSAINSLDELETGINRFITLALLWYGNIKFAFKTLSKNPSELEEKVSLTKPYDIDYYLLRHPPISDLESIPAEKTYLLGYLSADKINQRLKLNKNDQEALELQRQRTNYIKIGKKNQIAYLTSDHLDIYVATSIRLDHEFIFVSRLISSVFSNKTLKELKIRWSDPTQGYCDDRIDKGLSEALMLKRSKCTLYLVQEADTLGKDSELASTLAQGKPVIAYVPVGNKKYVDRLIKDLRTLNPRKNTLSIIREQLEVFNPDLAWNNKEIISWLDNKKDITLPRAKELLYEAVKKHYDKRANTLANTHPLSIQVNLISGVANGVLVVRNEKDCAHLIYSVLMNDMKFDIVTKGGLLEKYVYLREKISKTIFRVKTGDKLLDNSFWNFYTEPN